MGKSNDVSVRLALPEDAQAILAIYAPYITDSAITFSSKVPGLSAFRDTMETIAQRYPYLVCTIDDTVVGFAYANEERPHEAYRWNAELTVYLDPAHQGRGIATALYTALINILKCQGFCNLYAAITLPNDASIALHKHFGFTEAGIHHKTGYKLGAWRDVLWLQRPIENAVDPETHGAPISMNELNANQVTTINAMATALLSGVR